MSGNESNRAGGIRGESPECRHVWTLIDALADEDPSPDALAEIGEHFARCVKCADAEASLEEVLALYRSDGAAPVPAGVEQRLLDCMCGQNLSGS